MVALQGRQWRGQRRPAGETAAALRGGCFTCGGRKGATSCSKRQRGKEKEDEPELDGEDGKRHGVVYFQGLVGSMPLQLLEVGFHVEIHAIEWHDFQRETQFHVVVVA